jgi:hypothetical protein
MSLWIEKEIMGVFDFLFMKIIVYIQKIVGA